MTGRARLATVASLQHGFLSPDDLAIIAADPETRLDLLLVRCGSCRFLAPANQTQTLLDIIAAEKSTYVRDVSIPANSYVLTTSSPR